MARGEAATLLLKKADALANVKVHFGCKLSSVNFDSRCEWYDR